MSAVNQLTWDNFRSTVLLPGQQRVHRLTDSPRFDVFGDGVGNRIGVLIETAPDAKIPSELSKLASISARTLSEGDRVFLEVATSVPTLYRQFYHFVLAVAERVMVEKRKPEDAITLELQCFTDLLEEKDLLGIERQIGLLGELLFLERLIAGVGACAVDAWLGPTGEPHDFRLGASAFEVKTTMNPRRVHIIHSTEQLVPASGITLYLISVLLGPAGVGQGSSLSQVVSRISQYLASTPSLLRHFERALEASGFHFSDSIHYTRPYGMRRPMGMIPVGSSFPAITRATIINALGSLAPRIESVQYDLNVEGLEDEDGTPKFDSVIAGALGNG